MAAAMQYGQRHTVEVILPHLGQGAKSNFCFFDGGIRVACSRRKHAGRQRAREAARQCIASRDSPSRIMAEGMEKHAGGQSCKAQGRHGPPQAGDSARRPLTRSSLVSSLPAVKWCASSRARSPEALKIY